MGDPHHFLNLASQLQEAGAPWIVVETVGRVAQRFSSEPSPLFTIIDLIRRAQRSDRAAVWAKDLEELGGVPPELRSSVAYAWLSIARTLAQSGRCVEAQVAFQRSLDLTTEDDPHGAELRSSYAELWADCEAIRPAVPTEVREQARPRDPLTALVWLADDSKPEEAPAIFERVLKFKTLTWERFRRNFRRAKELGWSNDVIEAALLRFHEKKRDVRSAVFLAAFALSADHNALRWIEHAISLGDTTLVPDHALFTTYGNAPSALHSATPKELRAVIDAAARLMARRDDEARDDFHSALAPYIPVPVAPPKPTNTPPLRAPAGSHQTTYGLWALTVPVVPAPWSQSQWAICQELLAPWFDNSELGSQVRRIGSDAKYVSFGRLKWSDPRKWTRSNAIFWEARFDVPSLSRCDRLSICPSASLVLSVPPTYTPPLTDDDVTRHAAVTFAVAFTHPLISKAEAAMRELAAAWKATGFARKTRYWWVSPSDFNPHCEAPRVGFSPDAEWEYLT